MNIVNSQTNNNIFKTFQDFSASQTGLGSYNNVPASKDSLEISNIKGNQQIASVSVSDVKDKSHKGAIAATLGSSILGVGLIAFFVSKGFSSSTYQKINDLISHLNDKIYNGKTAEKTATLLDKGNIALAKGAKKLLTAFKAFANFNAIKDSSIDYLFERTSVTRNIRDGITKYFKKVSYKTIDKAYDNVSIKTSDLSAELSDSIEKIRAKLGSKELKEQIEIKGIKKSLGAWLNELEQNSNQLESTFDKGFGKKARLARKNARETELTGLNERVRKHLFGKDTTIFKYKNAENYTSYITEELSNPKKFELKDDIIKKRRAFSNNVDHNYEFAKSSLREIGEKLDIKDTDCRPKLEGILKKLDAYKSLSGKTEIKDRENLVSELKLEFNSLKAKIDEKYTTEKSKQINEEITFLFDKVINNDKKGEIQKILTIVNGLNHQASPTFKIFDDKLAKSIDRKAHEITKGINNATKLEAGDLYDKCAEFAVGSATSDMIGLLAPIGLATYSISKADDKKERISNTLTTGIPIIGTIATMFVGTAKMFSGPKNLIISSLVGVGLNTVGNTLNKIYEKYEEQHSFTKMAVEAYRNNKLLPQIPIPQKEN